MKQISSIGTTKEPVNYLIKKKLICFVYINRSIVAECNGYDKLEDEIGSIRNRLERDGYKCIYQTNNYYIYINIITQDCQIIAYKVWRGFYDRNGNKIYDGDVLENKDGKRVEINPRYEDMNTFYYRIHGYKGYGDFDWADFAIEDTDFTTTEHITKVKDVFDTFRLSV